METRRIGARVRFRAYQYPSAFTPIYYGTYGLNLELYIWDGARYPSPEPIPYRSFIYGLMVTEAGPRSYITLRVFGFGTHMIAGQLILPEE